MNIEKLIAKEAARQAGLARWIARIQSPEEVSKRFWSKVIRTSLDECWLWMGCRSELGYGMLTHKRRHWKAHRFAYWLTFGDFDFALDVLHACDNPPCCNPNHLELGTAAENLRQAHSRGRWIPPIHPGSAHPMSKLTDDDVLFIREAFAQQTHSANTLSVVFGVTPENIRNIRRRKSWTHI